MKTLQLKYLKLNNMLKINDPSKVSKASMQTLWASWFAINSSLSCCSTAVYDEMQELLCLIVGGRLVGMQSQ